MEGRAGGWELGIPVAELKNTKLPSHSFSMTLIPYSRFSRIDQTDLENFCCPRLSISMIFEIFLVVSGFRHWGTNPCQATATTTRRALRDSGWFQRIPKTNNVCQIQLFMFSVMIQVYRSSTIENSRANYSGSVWDHPKPYKTYKHITNLTANPICQKISWIGAFVSAAPIW